MRRLAELAFQIVWVKDLKNTSANIYCTATTTIYFGDAQYNTDILRLNSSFRCFSSCFCKENIQKWKMSIISASGRRTAKPSPFLESSFCEPFGIVNVFDHGSLDMQLCRSRHFSSSLLLPLPLKMCCHYVVLPPRQIKSTVWLCGRIKNRRRQIQTFDQINNLSTTLLTFTIWNVTLLKNEPFMRYQRFKKGGRVAKSQFLRKKCAKIA